MGSMMAVITVEEGQTSERAEPSPALLDGGGGGGAGGSGGGGTEQAYPLARDLPTPEQGSPPKTLLLPSTTQLRCWRQACATTLRIWKAGGGRPEVGALVWGWAAAPTLRVGRKLHPRVA